MAPTESYDVTGKNTRATSSATDHRSSEEIRRDIERQRDELDVTTEVLQHKLAPRELAGQLWTDMRSRVGGGAGEVVDVIKRHPLPLGLIGAGIAWWIYETSTGHSLSFGNGDSYDEEDEEYGVGSSSTGSYGVGSSASRSSSLYGTGSQYGSDYESEYAEDEEGWRQRSMHLAQRSTEKLRSGAQSAREGFSNAVDRNPLALGAACFSLGILAGIAVPSTRWEDQTMGPASRKVSRRAKRAATEVASSAAHTAAERAERLREEVERSGPEHGQQHRDEWSRQGQSQSGSSRQPGWSGSGSGSSQFGGSATSGSRTGSDVGTAGSTTSGAGSTGGTGSHGPGSGSKAGSTGIGSTGPSTGSTATGGYGTGSGTGSSTPGSQSGRGTSSSTGGRQGSAGGTGTGSTSGQGARGASPSRETGKSGSGQGGQTGTKGRSGTDEGEGPDPWDANNPGRRRS